jgi:hypothetical protein
MLKIKYLSMISKKQEYPDLLPESNIKKILFIRCFDRGELVGLSGGA